jgi:hypothetical protein
MGKSPATGTRDVATPAACGMRTGPAGPVNRESRRRGEDRMTPASTSGRPSATVHPLKHSPRVSSPTTAAGPGSTAAARGGHLPTSRRSGAGTGGQGHAQVPLAQPRKPGRHPERELRFLRSSSRGGWLPRGPPCQRRLELVVARPGESIGRILGALTGPISAEEAVWRTPRGRWGSGSWSRSWTLHWGSEAAGRPWRRGLWSRW